MINLLNLKYFVMVAEEGNITRVAEKEHISQQSLSNHIKKMEDVLAVKLFDRTGGLSLTYAGERYYNYAAEVLRLTNEVESELSDLKDTKQGTLRIGISYTRGSAFLPKILPSFCKKYPHVNLVIMENNSQVLEDYLQRGHIDLYIATDLKKRASIEKVDLCHEKLYLVVPKEFLGTDVPDIFTKEESIENFKNYNFLMLTKANRIRKTVDEYLEITGQSINIALETENIETLYQLVCKGMGITVYSEMFMEKHFEKKNLPVSFIPIKGELFKSTLSIGYNKTKYLSSAAKEFIQEAKLNLL